MFRKLQLFLGQTYPYQLWLSDSKPISTKAILLNLYVTELTPIRNFLAMPFLYLCYNNIEGKKNLNKKLIFIDRIHILEHLKSTINSCKYG